MSLHKSIEVLRWHKGSVRKVADEVVKESKLEVYLNGVHLVSLACSPAFRSELAVGYLLTEGYLSSREELGRVSVSREDGVVEITAEVTECVDPDSEKRPKLIAAGGGLGKNWCREELEGFQESNPFKFRPERLEGMMQELQEESKLFRETGGSHAAALADPEGIEFFAEDIGRHNTLDKLVGRAFLERIGANDKAILLSGRLSSEMTVKAVNSRIAVLVSRSAPTDEAVKVARDNHLTLIGFLRDGRMTVYSGEDRVIR